MSVTWRFGFSMVSLISYMFLPLPPCVCVCVCLRTRVLVHMCVHAHVGQRPTLGVIIQVSPPLCCEKGTASGSLTMPAGQQAHEICLFLPLQLQAWTTMPNYFMWLLRIKLRPHAFGLYMSLTGHAPAPPFLFNHVNFLAEFLTLINTTHCFPNFTELSYNVFYVSRSFPKIIILNPSQALSRLLCSLGFLLESCVSLNAPFVGDLIWVLSIAI